jgi:uncharacterized phage protein (TIGR01671 family)
MREILFRGKRKDDGEWVYGLLTSTNPVCIDGVEVIPETVGGYIGLYDMKRKQMFEGDIIALWAGLRQPKMFLIKWSEDYLAWCAKDKHDENQFYAKHKFLSRMEIIGNIHDNPELLERVIEEETR